MFHRSKRELVVTKGDNKELIKLYGKNRIQITEEYNPKKPTPKNSVQRNQRIESKEIKE